MRSTREIVDAVMFASPGRIIPTNLPGDSLLIAPLPAAALFQLAREASDRELEIHEVAL